MLPHAVTTFVGAFLLFLVQPMIARFILPWYGGTPAVWTTCMLFFQALLLGGYLYSHLSVRGLSPRRQAILHFALLLAALLVLPINPSNAWKPASPDAPTAGILLLLLVNVGLPYFVLSTTGPLVQAWFSRLNPKKSPYRLYALSNVGSFLALLCYPFVVEPLFPLRLQGWIWSAGLGLFVCVSGYCAFLQFRAPTAPSGAINPNPVENTTARPPSIVTRGLWIALPAAASILLLSVTNHLCQDVAVVPFLWVAPLGLYLLSFVVCFDHDRWYVRPIWWGAFLVAVVLVLVAINLGLQISLRIQASIFIAVLFTGCMVCHGELARMRPSPKLLTSYYVMIAVGGVAGGIFVALIAPRIFDAFLELQVGLIITMGLVLAAVYRDKQGYLGGGRPRWAWLGLGTSSLVLAAVLVWQAEVDRQEPVVAARNFYGVLRVIEAFPENPNIHRFYLMHGAIRHGMQFTSAEKSLLPTSYFGTDTGLGHALRYFRRGGSLQVGVIGLGVGTIAAYGRPGDDYRFYEINPEVTRLARENFSYLRDSPAQVSVIPGDGRISLEQEPQHNFDVLVLDAFSGDAIPVHLLTREAFDVYLRHLDPDGVLAVHISNRHVDLGPVVSNLSEHFDLTQMWFSTDKVRGHPLRLSGTDWLLLTRNQDFIQSDEIRSRSLLREPRNKLAQEKAAHMRLWTDDYSNLLQVLNY